MRVALINDMMAVMRLGRVLVFGCASPVARDELESLDRLRLEIYGRNRDAGWWTDLRTGEPLKRNVGELLMLSVSELAEGAEGSYFCLADDKLPQYSMLTVEIADCIVRLLDICGGLSVPLLKAVREIAEDPSRLNAMQDGPNASMSQKLLFAVCYLARAMEGHRKKLFHPHYTGVPVFAIELAHCLLFLCKVAADHNLPLAEAFADKVLFNASRPDHKREARLGQGGKAY